jgi:hypothetical protein
VTGTALRFVPYRAGSSDIMKDLVAGHIDLTFDQFRWWCDPSLRRPRVEKSSRNLRVRYNVV